MKTSDPDGSEANARNRAGAAEVLVVIGNGMAGYKLCERLAALGGTSRYQVIVFGEEPRPAYDRVHLTQVLTGRAADQLLLAPKEWYADQQIELHVGDPVVAIDRKRRVVRSASGLEIVYDRLVFATGSSAFVPPLPGRNLPGVFVYRTIEDLAGIRGHATGCRRAAVLGGGLLGLEAAQALKDLGLQTWVVERGTSLLSRQLDPEAGRLLLAQVEKLGIHICTERVTEKIEALGSDRLLQFNTGECLRVQLVVITTGIRPRDELAAGCGLKAGPHGGIAVDDSLQTSDPRIFAIGECASHRATIYGLAAPAYQMADVLASALLGRKRVFTGADQSTWLKLPTVAVATLGEFHGNGETLVSREPGIYRSLVLQNGRIIGATAVGEWPEQARVQEAIERKRRLWRWEKRSFARRGRLWSGSTPRPVRDWPASSIICNCVGVRQGALAAACARGCSTVEQLAQATGACTVCGSCKPLLADFVGAPVVTCSNAGTRLLFAASLAALAAAMAIWLARPIAISDSVQGGFRIDTLWRSGTFRQATGFTVLGLALLSLLLSLRKRLPRFQFGEVATWRAVHATLGACTVVALVSHTGFRLGHNLNFVLMANFLTLALLGALAGGVTALEARLSGPAGRRLRAIWTAAHIAAVWPLPALIIFHVIAAYYF